MSLNQTYDHNKKAAKALQKPLRFRLIQYSIFVLAGPERACVTANSSWNIDSSSHLYWSTNRWWSCPWKVSHTHRYTRKYRFLSRIITHNLEVNRRPTKTYKSEGAILLHDFPNNMTPPFCSFMYVTKYQPSRSHEGRNQR